MDHADCSQQRQQASLVTLGDFEVLALGFAYHRGGVLWSCPNEPGEKLVERRGAQRARRAESRSSCSLRVSVIVSLRFTTSGRCPSARSRSRRTRSPSRSCDRCSDFSGIEPNIPGPSTQDQIRGAGCTAPVAPYLANRRVRNIDRLAVEVGGRRAVEVRRDPWVRPGEERWRCGLRFPQRARKPELGSRHCPAKESRTHCHQTMGRSLPWSQ
jgi:hypothetical protein